MKHDQRLTKLMVPLVMLVLMVLFLKTLLPPLVFIHLRYFYTLLLVSTPSVGSSLLKLNLFYLIIR